MKITIEKQDSTFRVTGYFTDINEMNSQGSMFQNRAASMITCHDTGGYYRSPFCSSQRIVFTLNHISNETRLQNLRRAIQLLSIELEADFQDLTQ